MKQIIGDEVKFTAGLREGEPLGGLTEESIKVLDLAYAWSQSFKQTKTAPNHKFVTTTPNKQHDQNRKAQ